MRTKKGTKVMRLTKGTMVEVFWFCTTRTIPNGFWRPAKIVCGNGRNYTVQYDPVSSSPDRNSFIDHKVPRKLIRPSPPMKDQHVKWVPGDLAEVFVHGIWRVGKVTAPAYGNNFIYMLLVGHTQEIAVKACNLRRRQMWANNKWVLIKKDAIMVFNEVAKELQIARNKVILGESASTVSSTGSCCTSGRPYQYPDFSHCDDDAESIFVPEKRISLSILRYTVIKSGTWRLKSDVNPALRNYIVKILVSCFYK